MKKLEIKIFFNRKISDTYYPGEWCHIEKGDWVTVEKLYDDEELKKKFFTFLDDILYDISIKHFPDISLSEIKTLDKEKVKRFLTFIEKNDLNIDNMYIEYDHS